MAWSNRCLSSPLGCGGREVTVQGSITSGLLTRAGRQEEAAAARALFLHIRPVAGVDDGGGSRKKGTTSSIRTSPSPLVNSACWWGKSSLLSVLLTSALTSSYNIPSPADTYQNVPSTISGSEKAQRIQKPNSAKAESCTRKCVGTCIRGGGGAPGEGPLNVRRPLVVFKEGFRSRQYCLVECSEICNLIGDGDDGP